MIPLPMARRTDYNALMRAILLLALTFYLTKLLLTDELPKYIHPKFTYFTASAGIGFVLMAVGQFRRAFAGTFSIAPLNTRLHLLYVAVICLGFLMRPHEFGADLAAKQGMNISQRSAAAKVNASVPVSAPAAAAVLEGDLNQVVTGGTEPNEPTPPTPGTEAGLAANEALPLDHEPVTWTPALLGQGLTMEGDTIVVSPGNFMASMWEIYDHHYKYAGKKLVMDGFVFHAPDTGSDEFALVRLVVTCHVAHATPDGLLVINPGAERPAEDTWYQMEGVLEPHMYMGQSTVRLRVTNMTPIEKPNDPYVYG